jgi:hypothetical protein
MSSFLIGALILLGTFGCTHLGLRLQKSIPDEILNVDMRDIIKVLIGVLGTLSALVLSLMINTARGSYDQQHQEVMELSAKLLNLDRALSRYGPAATPLRQDLKSIVAKAVEDMWPADPLRPSQMPAPMAEEGWVGKLQILTPETELQRFERQEALRLATDVMDLRWLLYEQSARSIPSVLLIVLAVWFALIFLCIGLISPRRSHVLLLTLVFLSSLSVSAAMVLTLELDRPFDGLLRVSGEPVLRALSHLGK